MKTEIYSNPPLNFTFPLQLEFLSSPTCYNGCQNLWVLFLNGGNVTMVCVNIKRLRTIYTEIYKTPNSSNPVS